MISNLLRMSVDLASMRDQHITIDFVGKFGKMPAQDATPLSLVLTELITNAVEHGLRWAQGGAPSPYRWGVRAKCLNVVVEDDGNGMDQEESNGMAKASGSALARRSLTLSSPTTSVAMCAGNMGVMVAPE